MKVNKNDLADELDRKANVNDVDSGFKKMSLYITKTKSFPPKEPVKELTKDLLSESTPEFESTETLTQMSKYEIIKSLKEELKRAARATHAKFEGFLGKMEFYSFCDKFADFTNSYEKMKTEVNRKLEEICEKLRSEVGRSNPSAKSSSRSFTSSARKAFWRRESRSKRARRGCSDSTRSSPGSPS